MRLVLVIGAAIGAVAAAVLLAGGSDPAPAPLAASATATATSAAPRKASGTATVTPAAPPKAPVRATCATRSEADFPGAFTDPDNLVAGPIAFVGGAVPQSPSVVREYSGQKYPVLVRAGHRVTVRVAHIARRVAGLAYGPLPQGEIELGDAHRTVSFVACRAGEPSGSRANGPVTFWSGFVLVARPQCVPLELFVDSAPSPRRTTVPLGGPC